MAAQEDIEAIVEQEREIPMLRVVKNNAILKNIFLINSPDPRREDSSKIGQDLEQTLLLGRHPNCQIRLEHPSISRFHLRINTKPSLKRLWVTDLSSVHGTWISGKRIEPNIRVDVNEGDALTIGKSSRVYRLHWIPSQKACELNNQVIQPIDVPTPNIEKDEEVKMDGNALLLENEVESANSPLKASQVLVSKPHENSKEMEDVNILICNNEDGNLLGIGCEHSADFASKAKASVTNQFETLTELEGENALVYKSEDAKPVDSASEASKSLPQSPNIKTLEERKVLSVVPLLEATKDFDMQFINLALEVLLDENPSPVTLGDMDKEKEGNICESSTGFLRERVIGQLEENQQFVEEKQSSQDLILSESEESPSGPALTSHLIDTLDCATTALFVNEASHRNEDQIPFNDEEDDGAWSFWFLGSPEIAPENNFSNIDKESQGTEGDNARKERNISEDPTSAVNESLLWSFWSGIPRAESVYSSSFLDADVLSQIETQNENSQLLGSMEKLCKSEARSPYRSAPRIFSRKGQFSSAPQIKTNRTMQEEIDVISIDNEDRLPNGARIDPITRVLFIGMDHPEEEYFTPEKENYTLNSQAGKRKSGVLEDDHQPGLEESLCSGAITKAGMDSDKSLSAYSSKENLTPKFIQEQKPTGQLSADHTKLSMLTTGLAQRTPLQTLFAGSPQKSISESHMYGANMSAYSNKENQTPKVLQEQKQSWHPSAEHTKTPMLAKREAQRTPLQSLCPDSPWKSISETHISGAGLPVYSSKENQTPKQKSACHPECTKMSTLAQRLPLQALFEDSHQKGISETHISGIASLSGYSNKENLTPKFLQEQKSASHASVEKKNLCILRTKEAQRMPFQTLFVDSPQKISDTHDSAGLLRSRDLKNYGSSLDKHKCSVPRLKRWTMVVDITCLLDKNSRKALQLLEGIKGTQLVIPRAVVRELEFMKQQASIFRRNTDAYLASQWIEECLVRTKWWIQMQNSMKDDGKFTEDEVLDYALYLRGIQNDEQLILLSDDATRMIEAMAEGLICETPEEFRESLINPFSKRFLWADSTPRGQTWSYLDDVILRDHFYSGSFKTTSAKGLKLVLLNCL